VYPDNIGVFAEVAEGRADVMLTDDVEAELKSLRDPRLCRSFAGTLNHVGKALWMRPDAALVEVVDGWLGKAMASGETQRWMDEAMRAAAEAAPHQN
jgi:cyclohexadienyl dehydratase